jgi:hypothetical protein
VEVKKISIIAEVSEFDSLIEVDVPSLDIYP